jgi:glycosyltransferase involved in cell wall biosynthesis
MSDNSIVSIIMIFFNAADFLQDAVESVLAQTHEHWELLLIDDGSTDTSTQIARKYAAQYPRKVIYLEHPDHQNRGKGVSRNLGIRHARGEYVAFLDADDIWLPNKLEQQTAILSSYPEAGMLYGDTLYWYSWTGNLDDVQKDFTPKLGVQTDILINPPKLIPLYIRGKAAVPCTCSILVKRKVIEEVKGFDETCQGINNFYEDQAFYAKICLVTPVVAVNTCWDRYRQRSSARREDIEKIIRKEYLARKSFLNWLDDYMTQCGIEEFEIRLAIRKELWLQESPTWLPDSEKVPTRIRWIKKWILRLEELILPASIRYRLWIRD